jgi:hypothetical protein
MRVPLSVASRRHFPKRHFKDKIIGKNVNGFLCLLPSAVALAIAAYRVFNLQAEKNPAFPAFYTQKSTGFPISDDRKF